MAHLMPESRDIEEIRRQHKRLRWKIRLEAIAEIVFVLAAIGFVITLVQLIAILVDIHG